MLYTPLTKKALALCYDAHRDQVDKSGLPYVFHPFHLAEQMTDEYATCVALLHDVVEDTDLTFDDVRAAGMPGAVVEALELLTHDPSEGYMDYVARIAGNPLARRVKQADLRHNSDTTRLDEVDEQALARVQKYAKALALLQKPADDQAMLGAIVGDIVGSVYEWDNIKTTQFPLFAKQAFFTDDTVMTLAVAQAFLNAGGQGAEAPGGNGLVSRALLGGELVASMQQLGHRYPDAGYGGRFSGWLCKREPKPYNSWGNGSAMRVSPVAWVARSVEQAELLAADTALPTHNHPEGVKGAQASAACAYLARLGYDNAEIRAYVERNHGYDLSFSLDDIRAGYDFDVSCQGSVPQAIVAFLESDGFEDAIRRAISIGGDSDTIAAITGGIAHARYGIPLDIALEARHRLTPDLLTILDNFSGTYL